MGSYRFGQYFVISESQIDRKELPSNSKQNKTQQNNNTGKQSENYYFVITCQIQIISNSELPKEFESSL